MMPWQTFTAIDALNERREYEHRSQAWLAHSIGWLGRVDGKKFPKTFLHLIGAQKTSKGIDEDAIRAQMQKIRERAQSGNDSRKDGGRSFPESG